MVVALPERRERPVVALNAYFCMTRLMDLYQETIAGYPRYEEGRHVALVVAPSRGRAKTLFFRNASQHDGFVEWTDVANVRKVATNVPLPEGCVADNDPFWDAIDWEKVP